jgi:hypothetical protein
VVQVGRRKDALAGLVSLPWEASCAVAGEGWARGMVGGMERGMGKDRVGGCVGWEDSRGLCRSLGEGESESEYPNGNHRNGAEIDVRRSTSMLARLTSLLVSFPYFYL